MKKYNIQEILIVITIFILIVFGFLFFTGIFTSSYHLVDDHEFVRILSDIQKEGFFQTLVKWVVESFTIRFRPLYFVIRVCLTAVFGLHFKLWYAWKALELIVTMVFLYLFAKNLKCNKFVAFIFAIFGFIGMQTAVWYRLGPQEVTGMFFLSIAAFFISEHCLNKKKKLYIVIFSISLVLMSLLKESFVLMLPPMVFLKLILDYYNSQNDKIFDIIKKNLPFIISFAIVFIIEMIVIVFFVGTDKIGYAGFSEKTTLEQYINGIEKSFFASGIIEPMLLVFSGLGISLCYLQNKESKKEKTVIILFLLFVAMIMIFQFVLHAKSTMFERYIIPLSFAYSFIGIIMASKGLKGKLANTIYFGIVILIIIRLFSFAIPNAKIFAINGYEINSFLSYVKEIGKEDDYILVNMDVECAYSTSHYLAYSGLKNLYRYVGNNQYTFYTDPNIEPEQKFSLDEIKDKINIVITNQNSYKDVNQYININDTEEFNAFGYGNYIVYNK